MASIQALIEWPQLRATYIEPGIPFEQSLVNDPGLSLVFDPSPSRLGLRLRLPDGRTWSGLGPLKNVVVRKVLIDGVGYVEVLTGSPDLFRPIYALIGDVLTRVAEGQSDVLRALELSLADFESLLSDLTGMSREKAIGLYGELWVLRELLKAKAAKLDSWVGADQQLHDFRIGTLELEVKTTAGNTRRHTIHGLNQLTPSPSHTLALVSLRIGLAGFDAGESLRDLVESLRVVIGADECEAARFGAVVGSVGYDPSNDECQVRYRLAATPMTVAIGSDFPELSYAWLHRTLGDEAASRVRGVDLTLDLEGLGKPFVARSISVEAK